MGQPLDFHVDMFRYIARPLITPAPIYFRAQLNQHRQTFEAAAIKPALPVNMLIVPLLFLPGGLLFPGDLGRCYMPRMRLHYQRRQGTRLNRFGALNPCQGFHFQSGFCAGCWRRKAGHVFHDFKLCQADSSCCIIMFSQKKQFMQAI